MKRNRIATLLIAFFLIQQAGAVVASALHYHGMAQSESSLNVDQPDSPSLSNNCHDSEGSAEKASEFNKHAMHQQIQPTSAEAASQTMDCCDLSCDCCVGGCQSGLTVPLGFAVLPRTQTLSFFHIPHTPQAPAASLLRPPITS